MHLGAFLVFFGFHLAFSGVALLAQQDHGPDDGCHHLLRCQRRCESEAPHHRAVHARLHRSTIEAMVSQDELNSVAAS